MLDPLFYLKCNCGKIYWKQIFPLLQYSVESPPYTSSSLFFYLTSILDFFNDSPLSILILLPSFHSWFIYPPYASSSLFLYPTSILDLFIRLAFPHPFSYIQLPFLIYISSLPFLILFLISNFHSWLIYPYASSSLILYPTSILGLFIFLTLPHPHSYIQLPFLTYLSFLGFLILILISNFHSWLIYPSIASSSLFLYPTSILDLFILLTFPHPFSYIQLPFLTYLSSLPFLILFLLSNFHSWLIYPP